MKSFTRKNRTGLPYTLIEMGSTLTEIQFYDKKMTVDASIMQMEEGWHRWIEMGNMVQDAFPFLSSDEREFLMTGTTPAEWDRMFGHTIEDEHVRDDGQPTDD